MWSQALGEIGRDSNFRVIKNSEVNPFPQRKSKFCSTCPLLFDHRGETPWKSLLKSFRSYAAFVKGSNHYCARLVLFLLSCLILEYPNLVWYLGVHRPPSRRICDYISCLASKHRKINIETSSFEFYCNFELYICDSKLSFS